MRKANNMDDKIILIIRKTRLEELIARFNTLGQARFYLEHLGADFEDYQREHQQYVQAAREAETTLKRLGNVQVVDRSFLPNFIFGPQDIVVVLGQDGLVANTMKYLDGHPVIGVNPDPVRWDGVLLPFLVEDLEVVVGETFAASRNYREVSLAEVKLNDGQTLYAVNDLFIGPKNHKSLRYTIKVGDMIEQQSSSGVIISTGLGSTGWLKSLVAGARGVVHALGGRDLELDDPTGFDWAADKLYFTVREPFPSRVSTVSLVFGAVRGTQKMIIESLTPEDGVIFSDGLQDDYLAFNSGTRAEIGLAARKGVIVV
ncbi:MAG: sugar kinase [Desulfobulbaceae bacterium]|nr:sugar kinase [Desulfobulbaceae bacterium]